MMEILKLLVALTLLAAVMWWVLETPSRAVGQGRAMIVAVVCLLVTCIGEMK